MVPVVAAAAVALISALKHGALCCFQQNLGGYENPGERFSFSKNQQVASLLQELAQSINLLSEVLDNLY